MQSIFVTGIGTEVGKTIVSAILVEALSADYWKPVQAGLLPQTDSEMVRSLISNHTSVIHPEQYRLEDAVSPHRAAAKQGIQIDLAAIRVPQTPRALVIEGAGGVLTPLSKRHLIIDLITAIGAGVVLVSRNYLGSINHTLLSIEALQRRDIPVLGLVFNGDASSESEAFILERSGVPSIAALPWEDLCKQIVSLHAQTFRERCKELRIGV